MTTQARYPNAFSAMHHRLPTIQRAHISSIGASLEAHPSQDLGLLQDQTF
jgi:hypothetical protein